MELSKIFFETTLTQMRISEMVETGQWSERWFDPIIDRWAEERGDQIAVTDRFGSTSWSALATQVDAVSYTHLTLPTKRIV